MNNSSAVAARHKKIRYSKSDLIFYIIVTVILSLFTLLVLFPLVYVVSASFSSPKDVAAGRVYLWPVNFSLEGYKAVFSYPDIWIGYRNTILYTIVGTAVSYTHLGKKRPL